MRGCIRRGSQAAAAKRGGTGPSSWSAEAGPRGQAMPYKHFDLERRAKAVAGTRLVSRQGSAAIASRPRGVGIATAGWPTPQEWREARKRVVGHHVPVGELSQRLMAGMARPHQRAAWAVARFRKSSCQRIASSIIGCCRSSRRLIDRGRRYGQMGRGLQAAPPVEMDELGPASARREITLAVRRAQHRSTPVERQPGQQTQSSTNPKGRVALRLGRGNGGLVVRAKGRRRAAVAPFRARHFSGRRRRARRASLPSRRLSERRSITMGGGDLSRGRFRGSRSRR